MASVFGTLTVDEGTMKKFPKNATGIQMCCEWALFKRVKFQQTTWPLHHVLKRDGKWQQTTYIQAETATAVMINSNKVTD